MPEKTPKKPRYPKPFDYFPQKGGLWLERSLYQSPAFCSLSKNGHLVLVAALDARKFERVPDRRTKKKKKTKLVLVNGEELRIPYKRLQEKYFMNMAGVTRGFDELLAKGFLRIAYHGGGGKGDLTLYALSEDYLRWHPGAVFQIRPKGIKSGFQIHGQVINQ